MSDESADEESKPMFESVDLYRLFRFIAPGILPVFTLELFWPDHVGGKELLVGGVVASIMLGAIISTLVQGADGRAKALLRLPLDGGALSEVKAAADAELAKLSKESDPLRKWIHQERVRTWIPEDSDALYKQIVEWRRVGSLYSSRYYFLAGSALGFLGVLSTIAIVSVQGDTQARLANIEWRFAAPCLVGYVVSVLCARATMLGEIRVINDFQIAKYVVEEQKRRKEELKLAEARKGAALLPSGTPASE